MTPAQYQVCVERTLLKDGTPMPLHYATLGLAGEAGEVLECLMQRHVKEDDLLNEVGDVLWYVAACARAIGSSFERVVLITARDGGQFLPLPKGRARALCVLASKFADKVKKRCWHGRIYDVAELELDLACVYAACARVTDAYTGRHVSAAMAANDAKLRARYPEGFVEGHK